MKKKRDQEHIKKKNYVTASSPKKTQKVWGHQSWQNNLSRSWFNLQKLLLTCFSKSPETSQIIINEDSGQASETEWFNKYMYFVNSELQNAKIPHFKL